MPTVTWAPKFQYTTEDGLPAEGYKLYTYAAGTSTPLATYTNYGGGTPNANPVVLDASGTADVWLTASTLYKFILKDANDVTVWTVDNFGASM